MISKSFFGIMSFVLLLGFISMGLIGGCGSSGGSSGSNSAPPLTEIDFSGDPSLAADPEQGVVVTLLEPPDSEDPGVDTGDTGVDEIPYKYTAPVKKHVLLGGR